jgi:hypothetical protein
VYFVKRNGLFAVQFYADVMQCEYDMTHATYRMQKELCDEFAKQPPECASLFAIMQV